MQERQTARFFLEILVVVVILGTLLAVAIPHINRLFNKDETESYESELHQIQTAVAKMLVESTTKTLVPVGPTSDMGEVHTSDTPPLVLTNYLPETDGRLFVSESTYVFSVNGTVTKASP